MEYKRQITETYVFYLTYLLKNNAQPFENQSYNSYKGCSNKSFKELFDIMNKITTHNRNEQQALVYFSLEICQISEIFISEMKYFTEVAEESFVC